MAAQGASESSELATETDAVFEVLANRRRRLAVRVLDDASGPLGIGPLATRVAARERGVDPADVTSQQRKSAYTALHQNHLPMLADVGVVTADREWVDVRLTDRASVVASHLQYEDDRNGGREGERSQRRDLRPDGQRTPDFAGRRNGQGAQDVAGRRNAVGSWNEESEQERAEPKADRPFRSVAVGMGVCAAVPVAFSAAVSPPVVAAVAGVALVATLAWYRERVALGRRTGTSSTGK
jgi:hypothetical protein